MRVRGHVASGRIVVDDDVDLPDGAQVELVVVDDEWSEELDEELLRRLAVLERDGGLEGTEVIARLRGPR